MSLWLLVMMLHCLQIKELDLSSTVEKIKPNYEELKKQPETRLHIIEGYISTVVVVVVVQVDT